MIHHSSIYLLPCNSRITFDEQLKYCVPKTEDHEYGYIPSHCKYFDSRPPRHYQLDLPLPFFLHDSTRQARDLNVKASLEFEFAEKFSRRKRGPFWRTADSICLNCWNRAGGESFIDWAKPFCIIYKEKRGRLSRKRGHSDVFVNWVL